MKPILTVLAAIFLFGCSGTHHSNSRSFQAHSAHAFNYDGSAYVESCQVVLLARELTDKEIEDALNGPGSGFHDSKEAAENSDKYVLDYYEMDDGTIIIIDNEIHIIS